jgi:N-acetyl-anhydromuramyl-L-alanine amidase AmpD
MSLDYGPAEWYPALDTAFTPTKGRRIDMLVLHATAGRKTGDLYTLSGRDRLHLVSCHYYVTKAGEVYQLVRDKDIAWHAGVTWWQGEGNANAYSLGIELENLNTGSDPYPHVQFQVVTTLARAKVKQFHIPQLRCVTHADIAIPRGRKSDPAGFPWDTFLHAVYAADPTLTQRWMSLYNGVYVREAPTTKSPIAWNGRARLWEGQVIDSDKVVTGENHTGAIYGRPVASNQWVHWPPAGFIWQPQLQRIG